MLFGQDITQLGIICEDYNIALPDYVLAAQHLKAATAALYVKVGAETPPTTNGVTTKTLEATFKALLAWPGHDARLAVADRLSQVADTAEVDAWARFSQTLMEQLRAPFDEAAAAFTGSDGPALVTLTELNWDAHETPSPTRPNRQPCGQTNSNTPPESCTRPTQGSPCTG